jgi:hypothetical protein
MTWHGDKVAASVHDAAAAALYEAAEVLLEESNRSVPHDEGTLERSGEVSADPASLESCVSYDTPYAARLHEKGEKYNWSKPGARWKWLEFTMREQATRLRDLIASRIKKAFG